MHVYSREPNKPAPVHMDLVARCLSVYLAMEANMIIFSKSTAQSIMKEIVSCVQVPSDPKPAFTPVYVL